MAITEEKALLHGQQNVGSMTIRDMLASSAMQGMIANSEFFKFMESLAINTDRLTIECIAASAVEAADALLIALAA